MQRVNTPKYAYDALGRLTNYTPSGGSADVVSSHVMLDPRISGPRSLVQGGLQPVIHESPQTGNAALLQGVVDTKVNPVLYTPPLSLTSPPVVRPKTDATILGHATFSNQPESQDLYAVTTARPILDVPHDTGSKRSIR